MLTPPSAQSLVFLVDVDNTLLDNDRFAADLSACLEQRFGDAGRERYWQIYEQVRDKTGLADYLTTLQRFRTGLEENPQLLAMSGFLLDYPFHERFYPDALAVVAHLRSLGRTLIFSDGDVVFQPRKIHRSGLWDAFGGDVIIAVHKQNELAAMQRRVPADHYVMIDDKPALLAAMKQQLGDRLTTVFVRQGHYAAVPLAAGQPQPDLEFAQIGGMMSCQLSDFVTTTPAAPNASD